MQHVNTRKLTKQLNQALRRSWVILQEKERHLVHNAGEYKVEEIDEAPIDELIETVEQFLDDVKATREKSNRRKHLQFNISTHGKVND